MSYLQKNYRELTAHDLAFGIGRKATKAEVDELLAKPAGKNKSAQKVLTDLAAHLTQRKNRKKAS
jgi:hypothetical protein